MPGSFDQGAAADALIAAGLPVDSVSVTYPGGVAAPVVVWLPGVTPTAQQSQRAAAVLASAGVSAAQAARFALLESWYAAKTGAGVTVGGTTLAADVASQNRFDALTTVMLAALAVGSATQATPFTAYDIGGRAVTLPMAQMIGLLLQYAASLQALAGSFAATLAAILAAQTPDAVAAVPLPQ